MTALWGVEKLSVSCSETTCHPDRSVPRFPAACAPFCKGKVHEVHQRNQVPQEIRESVAEGSAVFLGSSKERNASRTANRRILSGERQSTGLLVDAKRGNVITAVIARIQKISARIDRYISRIIPHRRSLTNVMQPAVAIQGKHSNRILEPVG